MTTATKELKMVDKLVQHYESHKQQLLGADDSCISEHRKEALKHLLLNGLPNKKNEEYKYTNIEALLKSSFELAAPETVSSAVIAKLSILEDCIKVVFINGFFSLANSNIEEVDGLVVSPFSKAISHNHQAIKKHFCKHSNSSSDQLEALNTALFKDGLFIHVLKNIQVKKPIHIIHVTTSNADVIVQPRHLVIAESGSEVTIVESFETIDLPTKSFTNCLMEIIVCENASVKNYLLQNECENGNQVNTKQVHQEKNSFFKTMTITTNGGLIRNNLNIALNGENIQSDLFGLYLADKKMHVDNHTLVDHRMPHCNSNELYKGIANGNSTAVFNGKIFVRQDAQKTNAFQSNKNILLSDNATVNTKPQLEIFADDVKCSHGTSTGRIDEEAMFYLRSRGIGEDNAKKLLMHAFAEEVTDKIEIEELRDHVEKLISKHFQL